ncbi:MAG: hypothetical protein ACI9H6_000253 [Patiriisocius sp.]|jgi:hypothetical protein
MIKTILGIVLACSIATIAGKAQAEAQYAHLFNDPVAQTEFMKGQIRRTFQKYGEAVVQRAIRVAACESSGTPNGHILHWDAAGNLLPNREGGQARASFQVMSVLHRPDLDRRGLSINVLADYMEFVEYLYKRNGSFQDWYPSEYCWSYA